MKHSNAVQASRRQGMQPARSGLRIALSLVLGLWACGAAAWAQEPVAPTITSQPSSQAVNPGATVQFMVQTTGTLPIGYRWRKDTADLSDGGRIFGATLATLTISGAVQGDEGAYVCIVSNDGGTTQSLPATLTVNDPVVFTTQPKALTQVNPGVTISLSVAVSGTAPLTYQWRKDGQPLINPPARITGATSATLTITSSVISDGGIYTCRVTNPVGSVSSGNGRVIVNPTLTVVTDRGTPTPPAGSAVYTSGTRINASLAGSPIVDTTGTTRWRCTGWSGTGSVPASGTATNTSFYLRTNSTLTWKWELQHQLNTTITQAGAGRVTLANRTTTADGTWHTTGTRVSINAIPNPGWAFGSWSGDAAGNNTSTTLMLDKPRWVGADFLPAPRITQEPIDTAAVLGTTATFSIVVSSAIPFTAQWTKDGADLTSGSRIQGVTSTTLTIGSVTTGDIGLYRCNIFSANANLQSRNASLSIRNPQIKIHPASKAVNPGTLVHLAASADGDEPIEYQWKKNGTALSEGGSLYGATQSTLTIMPVAEADEGLYSCVAFNAYGTTETLLAFLSVNDPVAITGEPQDMALNPGGMAAFHVETTGTQPVTYQWKKDGANLASDGRISGATSATLRIAACSMADAGRYVCRVSNVVNQTDTRAARLTVHPTLEVISAHGTGAPSVGTHVYTTGTTVNAMIGGSPELDTTGTTRWVNTGWTGTGSVEASGTTTQTVFQITSDSQLTWQWKTQYKFDATSVPPQGGLITMADGATTLTSLWSDVGGQIVARPKPAKGYVFGGWGGDASAEGKATSITVVMIKPKSITANFWMIPVVTQHPVTQSVNSGWPAELDVVCSGTAPLQYQWLKDGQALTDDAHLAGATSSTLRISRFLPADHGKYRCVVKNAAGQAVSREAKLMMNYRLGIVSPWGDVPPSGELFYTSGSTATVLMSPMTVTDPTSTTRHIVKGWLGEGAAPPSGSGRFLAFTMDRDSTVTWLWRNQFLLQTAVNPPESGQVFPAGGTWLDEGAVVELQAVPGRFTAFAGWSGDLGGHNLVPALVMDRPKSVTGNFTLGTGTVQVNVYPPTAKWTLVDGRLQTRQGTGNAILENIPAGQISMTWEPIEGYYPPTTNPVLRILSQGGKIDFSQVFISSSDAAEAKFGRILRYLLGEGYSPEGLDVNGDGQVNVADLLQAAQGMEE